MTDEKPSLDDVYNQYGVTGDQRQPEQSAEQQTATSPTLDIAGQMAALVNEVQNLRAESDSIRQEAVRTQEKADLKDVLDKLGGKLEGVKSKHVKYALAERYEEDPKFKELWDNRSDNPDAFNAALDALTPILQEDLAVRADPKIAEDQQAFDNALSAADQTRSEAADDETHRLMKLSPGEFEREWRALVSGG
jgi:hypothetical protein